MGITGTEVAKKAADIVVADDNFATIVGAVEQGRLVFDNLRKVILFLFTTSIDEIVILLATLLLGYPLPLAAVQILWINVVTEGVLTVNLVMEGPEGDEMDRQPVSRNEPLMTTAMCRRMAVMAASAVAATLGFFIWRLETGAPFALVRSETFTLLVVCQWFNVLNCRSNTASVFSRHQSGNCWLFGGLLLGNILQFWVIYAAPLNQALHTVPIPFADFLLIGVVASLVLWTEELRKWLARRRSLRRSKLTRSASPPRWVA
jgi:Ca2+-transporting ATPase